MSVCLSLHRSDVDFSLSLNGTEVLLDTGQTLSSCGVVSGDMITVILPQQIQTAPETPSGANAVTSRSREEVSSDQKYTHKIIIITLF